MNDTLKVAGRIGAELGAAKAECEKLRGLLAETLRYIDDETATAAMMSRLAARIDNALSQQAEPDDDVPDFTPGNGNKARRRMEALGIAPKVEPKCSTCNDVGIVGHSMICPECEETWTPSVEPIEQVAAQTVYVECRECSGCGHVGINDSLETNAACDRCSWIGPSPSEDTCPGCAADNVMSAACPNCGCIYRLLADAEIATRPAQTEQQPIRLPQRKNLDGLLDPESKRAGRAYNEALEDVELLNAAPIAQTAPTPWQEATGRAAFKNFHRSLCDRFGYTHDEEFWWRDLISLEEHIAKQTAPQPEQSGLVEAAQGALAEIQAALEDAYLNAYQECCGQAYLECCGSPVQAWSEADQKVMDRFAQHERALRAALSAQRGDA
jgi:hypothetical protein